MGLTHQSDDTIYMDLSGTPPVAIVVNDIVFTDGSDVLHQFRIKKGTRKRKHKRKRDYQDKQKRLDNNLQSYECPQPHKTNKLMHYLGPEGLPPDNSKGVIPEDAGTLVQKSRKLDSGISCGLASNINSDVFQRIDNIHFFIGLEPNVVAPKPISSPKTKRRNRGSRKRKSKRSQNSQLSSITSNID